MADGTGNGGGGDYQTFAGAGFGTLMVQLSSGTTETPPSPLPAVEPLGVSATG